MVSGAQDIVTNKRSLETTVIVDNGQTVVLGGLIRDKVTEDIQAVPILSRIPLLGELFKFRSRTKTKTNLMVFLRPIIVRSPEDSEGFTSERYEYIRTQQQNMRMDATLIPKYEIPVLPPLVQPEPAPQVKDTKDTDTKEDSVSLPESKQPAAPSDPVAPRESNQPPDTTNPDTTNP